MLAIHATKIVKYQLLQKKRKIKSAQGRYEHHINRQKTQRKVVYGWELGVFLQFQWFRLVFPVAPEVPMSEPFPVSPVLPKRAGILV